MQRNESEGARAYPTTHWSLIYLTNEADQEVGRQALDTLLRKYLSPLQRHIERKFGASEDDAKDWLQSFVAQRILAKRLLKLANKDRGRFRTFLLNALDNFVIDQIRSRNRRAPPVLAQDGQTSDPPLDGFDVEWAVEVIDEAKRRTRAFYEGKGRGRTWAVFNEAIFLPERKKDRPTDAALAALFGFDSARQASNAIFTAQREFGRQLRAVIQQYEFVKEPARINDELRDLISIMSRRR